MPKNLLLVLFFIAFATMSEAQPVVGNSTLTRDLYQKAKGFVAIKDYPNAVLVYNQLVQLEPQNLIYRRELAYTYYLGKDFMRATKVITPILKLDEVDDNTFLIASKIFVARDMNQEAVKTLSKGIKKFPHSGLLYAEKGNLYLQRKKYENAVKEWEKGVKAEPDYHMNYYNLAKSYFVSKRPLWAIIYGETYINLESYSMRTEEMKKIVFDSYKQLIANGQLNKFESKETIKQNSKYLSSFEKDVKGVYDQLSYLVLGGVDLDNITMLRTRFLLEWMNHHSSDYPFALFDFTTKIIEDGQFEVYNTWLFGKANNDKEFTKWAREHAKELNSFEEYYRKLNFKPKENQYYK